MESRKRSAAAQGSSIEFMLRRRASSVVLVLVIHLQLRRGLSVSSCTCKSDHLMSIADPSGMQNEVQCVLISRIHFRESDI